MCGLVVDGPDHDPVVYTVQVLDIPRREWAPPTIEY